MIPHFYEGIEGFFNFDDLYTEVVSAICRPRVPVKVVEVGVFKGRSLAYLAVELARSGVPHTLYGVDTFDGSSGTEKDPWQDYRTMRAGDSIDYAALVDGCFEAGIEPPTLLQMLSMEAAALFDDKSLDFVFLDADHEYDSVRQDINVWEPKVRTGGFLGGHDYGDSKWVGVKRAVDERFPHGARILGSSWLVTL